MSIPDVRRGRLVPPAQPAPATNWLLLRVGQPSPTVIHPTSTLFSYLYSVRTLLINLYFTVLCLFPTRIIACLLTGHLEPSPHDGPHSIRAA